MIPHRVFAHNLGCLLLSAAAVLLPATASAQQPSWAGLYLGGHLGGAWGSLGDADVDGFIGGGHGGLNFQNGNLVYGIEADISLSGADGGSASASGGCLQFLRNQCVAPFSSTTSAAIDLDWLASLRARLGFTVGNALIYGTGGIGWGNVDLKINDPVLGSSSSSNTHVGWVGGGGVEMRLSRSLSGRVEALRYGLGSESYDILGTATKLDLDVTVVRGGLTYHFN